MILVLHPYRSATHNWPHSEACTSSENCDSCSRTSLYFIIALYSTQSWPLCVENVRSTFGIRIFLSHIVILRGSSLWMDLHCIEAVLPFVRAERAWPNQVISSIMDAHSLLLWLGDPWTELNLSISCPNNFYPYHVHVTKAMPCTDGYYAYRSLLWDAMTKLLRRGNVTFVIICERWANVWHSTRVKTLNIFKLTAFTSDVVDVVVADDEGGVDCCVWRLYIGLQPWRSLVESNVSSSAANVSYCLLTL